jgi:hypothetical protein
MATWQLLLAVWAIGIPALLLAPGLLPPRRPALVRVAPDSGEPASAAVLCEPAPRRAARGHCVRPLTGSRQTRRTAAP